MPLISNRLNGLGTSPTLAISAKAEELKKQGKEIISLSAGEPDFDTPENIKTAAKKAINEGYTKYTSSAGSKELRQAIKDKFSSENGLDYELEEIVAGAGAKNIIYNALLATLNPDDEVIIPKPYWVSYPSMVKIAGAKAKFIETEFSGDFKLTPEQLEQAITPKTKWVILNSPNNPTGIVYTKGELEQLGEVLKKYSNIYILSDEIYEHIVYEGYSFVSFAYANPALKARTLTVNGVSKAYSMTGWRLGYAAGNKELINAIIKLQSHSTSGPCSISQKAAIEALTGPQHFLIPNAGGFERKRDLVIAYLKKVKFLSYTHSQGAFYLFINCSNFFGAKTNNSKVINSSEDFASYLLDTAGVAVVPGEAFGMNGFFRLSYATSEENLVNACERITEACRELF
jgi:aspartate aminotransferase